MSVWHSLRRRVDASRITSCVPRPTAAGDTARRFTFAFQDSPRRDVQARRREAIVNYLDGWPSVQIVAERRERDTLRCWVTITTARPMTTNAAQSIVEDCP